MANPVPPVAKTVYICDEVLGDSTTGKVSLLNIWDVIRVPAAATFPYPLTKVCVFVWWRGGHGKLRTRIEVVEAATEKAIRRTRDYNLNFEQRSKSVFACYRLADCACPGPGYYFVEVYCEDQFVDDQVVRVIHETGD